LRLIKFIAILSGIIKPEKKYLQLPLPGIFTTQHKNNLSVKTIKNGFYNFIWMKEDQSTSKFIKSYLNNLIFDILSTE